MALSREPARPLKIQCNILGSIHWGNFHVIVSSVCLQERIMGQREGNAQENLLWTVLKERTFLKWEPTSKYFMDGLNAQRQSKSLELTTRAYA